MFYGNSLKKQKITLTCHCTSTGKDIKESYTYGKTYPTTSLSSTNMTIAGVNPHGVQNRRFSDTVPLHSWWEFFQPSSYLVTSGGYIPIPNK